MTNVRLIYFSKFAIELKKGFIVSINDILLKANRNNKKNNITGALIFDNNWFVQVLEGERDAVWSTFTRIEKDNRHSDVTFVEMTAITERHFADWWMGCAERTVRTAAIFDRYQVDGTFQPAKLGATEIVALLMTLSGVGFHVEISRAA